LRNGKKKKLNQSFQPAIETVAVCAAGRAVISEILSFAVFVSGNLPGRELSRGLRRQAGNLRKAKETLNE
jgi:hypothetical protein